MSWCDWEMPEFYSARWVVARKEHKCVECGAPVFKGEKHGYFTGKWDGELESYRQHIECEDACRYIRDHFQGGECIAFGQLFEIWGDYSYRAKGRPEEEDHREFRAIMARVKWRRKKGRKLSWLPPYKLNPASLPGLREARERGWA